MPTHFEVELDGLDIADLLKSDANVTRLEHGVDHFVVALRPRRRRVQHSGRVGRPARVPPVAPAMLVIPRHTDNQKLV